MTAKEISDRVLKRIDDDSASPGSVLADASPVAPETLAAINEGQEFFSWISLCLESTADLTLAAATTFGSLRAVFPDFLCPLRLTVAGVRIRPATLAELDSLDDGWQDHPGTPSKYTTQGFSIYAVTPQPLTDTTASLTYARSPLQLVGDAFPEIPEQYHQSLVKYAVYRLKVKEGAQGLQRGMVQFNEFLDDAAAYGDVVRARSRASRYDTLPIEAALFDRSRLIEKVKKNA